MMRTSLRPILLAVGLVVLSGLIAPRAAEAQVEQPLQIALFDPIQLRPADQAILAVRVNQGNMLGWQSNVINLLEGELTGLQSGFFNSAGRGEGVQWGGVNMAGNFSGLQFSVVNVADDLYGVQVGIINVIRSKATFPVLPLVNWKF